MSAVPATCRHCNEEIAPEAVKALSGEIQMVWTGIMSGEWVCDITKDEHCPVNVVCSHRDTLPYTLPGTPPGTFVVMEGNPVDGFVIHGIPAFPDHDAAVEWAASNCDSEWWVMPLQDVD
jgi:hypothetical protein